MLPQDGRSASCGALPAGRGGRVGTRSVGLRQDEGGVELRSVRGARGERRVRAKLRRRLRRRAQLRCGDALAIPFRGRHLPPVVRARRRAHEVGSARRRGTALLLPRGTRRGGPAVRGHHRVVATVDEAPAEPSLSDVQALLDARGPRTRRTRVEEVVWSSRFRVAHRVAARFREGESSSAATRRTSTAPLVGRV